MTPNLPHASQPVGNAGNVPLERLIHTLSGTHDLGSQAKWGSIPTTIHVSKCWVGTGAADFVDRDGTRKADTELGSKRKRPAPDYPALAGTRLAGDSVTVFSLAPSFE